MMTDIFQYYGIDWLAMAFTLVAIYQLGNKQHSGFILMIIGNLFWIGLGVFTASLALVLANSIFAAMNLRGLYKWSRHGEAS